MATTTLRLPTELKERVAEVARQKGTSPHALMLEAIEESVALSEARQEFVDEADARYREMVDMGLGIAWEEFRTHLLALSEGRPSRTPRKRAWRK